MPYVFVQKSLNLPVDEVGGFIVGISQIYVTFDLIFSLIYFSTILLAGDRYYNITKQRVRNKNTFSVTLYTR